MDKVYGEVRFGPGVLYPISELSGTYSEQKRLRLVTLAIHVPSGSSQEKFKFRVTPDGNQLEVEYQWSQVLKDMSLLNKRWLEMDGITENIKDYLPGIILFRNVFRNVYQREIEKITYFAHISINCNVETNLHTFPLDASGKIRRVIGFYVTMGCAKDD